ncbi:ATP-binding cassette domain-containing protein, partial [Actinomadura roseirufa]|uniref:ATP-binding cassette domain-containing protein n=1 Tax=Actinomadura roseirufa TaxID=2094049 RepID=UPI001F5E9C23
MTFGVAEGVVGLAGPPGVGKSTLLATFATLRRPKAGALHILGHDIANAADLRAARARIGYLPGRLSHAEHMTAGELVAYAAYYKRAGASAAREMVRRLDLAEAAGTELCLLPPDVRVRAGIAAACVHRPDVVLLDDPFGGLRAAAGPGVQPPAAATAELIPVLRALAPTVVVTADDPGALAGWCDRLLTLTRGRLAESPAPVPRRVPDATARTVPRGGQDRLPGDTVGRRTRAQAPHDLIAPSDAPPTEPTGTTPHSAPGAAPTSDRRRTRAPQHLDAPSDAIPPEPTGTASHGAPGAVAGDGGRPRGRWWGGRFVPGSLRVRGARSEAGPAAGAEAGAAGPRAAR